MKLLVSDFDNTFSTSINDIKINCIEIAKFMGEGNVFALSSGRSYVSLLNVVRKYGIPHNYLTCFDGISLYDNNEKLLCKYEMDRKIVDSLYLLKKYDIHKTIYYVYGNDYVEKKMNLPISSISIPVNINKVTDEFLLEFEKIKINNPYYNFTSYIYGDYIYFAIKPKGVNKATGVEDLRKMLNIDYNDVYTVGDSLNDLEMIREYNGYAIGDNKEINKASVDNYKNVYTLVRDIKSEKIKRRI